MCILLYHVNVHANKVFGSAAFVIVYTCEDHPRWLAKAIRLIEQVL